MTEQALPKNFAEAEKMGLPPKATDEEVRASKAMQGAIQDQNLTYGEGEKCYEGPCNYETGKRVLCFYSSANGCNNCYSYPCDVR